MKDFHDIWLLSEEATIDGTSLYDSIAITFKSRGKKIPFETPVSLTQAFAMTKHRDWQALLRRANVGNATPTDFVEVVNQLYDFLEPVLDPVRTGAGFEAYWTQENQWQQW